MIPVSLPSLDGDEWDYVKDCIETNWISSKGKYVDRFEEAFSQYCDKEYGVTSMNGTSAIHLALKAIGVEEGTEVIVPSLTTAASVNPIIYCGGKPVFVDSEHTTWNIDPEQIEKKITANTKAILIVHLYGHPCNMDPITEVAERYGLYLIEDSAEAHGAEYRGGRAGSFGHLSCFSFYANKLITTGEGGMVCTNDEKLRDRVKQLKDLAYGKGADRFVHEEIGYNYRMTNMQAAVGLAQLQNIDKHIAERRRVASAYKKFLKEAENVLLPPENESVLNVYWMYTIVLQKSSKVSRNELMTLLHEKGIDTRPAFYPAHLQPIYRKFLGPGGYPIAEFIGLNGINLPTSNDLREDQIEFISDAVKDFIR